MIRSLEELLAAVRDLVGEELIQSDAGIALMEDITDTINAEPEAAPEEASDGIDWEAEAERIDREWREKYTKRFFTGSDPEDPAEEETEEEKSYTYEELFKEE